MISTSAKTWAEEEAEDKGEEGAKGGKSEDDEGEGGGEEGAGGG